MRNIIEIIGNGFMAFSALLVCVAIVYIFVRLLTLAIAKSIYQAKDLKRGRKGGIFHEKKSQRKEINKRKSEGKII
ncbi:MAG: hypothetical protein PVG39_00455 [Desulfobacteraceae bacterium]|jgi:hypothetical protein